MAPLLFLTLFVLTVSYALWRGGRPERAVALILLLALLGSLTVRETADNNFRTPLWQLCIVDTLTASAVVGLAVRAKLDWLMVMAALLTLSAMAHPARALGVDPMNWVYYILSVIWSYGTLVVLAWATWNRTREPALRNAKRRSADYSARSFLRRLLR